MQTSKWLLLTFFPSLLFVMPERSALSVKADSDVQKTTTTISALMVHNINNQSARLHFTLSTHDYNGVAANTSVDVSALDFRGHLFYKTDGDWMPISFDENVTAEFNMNGGGTFTYFSANKDATSWTGVKVTAGCEFPSYASSHDSSLPKACYALDEDVTLKLRGNNGDPNMVWYDPSYTFVTEPVQITGIYLQSVSTMVRMHFYVSQNDWAAIPNSSWWEYPVNSSRFAEMSAGNPNLIEINGTQNWTDGQVFYNTIGGGSIAYFTKNLGQDNAKSLLHSLVIHKGFLIPKLAFVGAGSIAPTTNQHVAYEVSEDFVWREDCTVIYLDDEGNQVKSAKVGWGLSSVAPLVEPMKTKDGYTYYFQGWANNAGEMVTDFTITGDTTYHAVYRKEIRKYTIVFADRDGNLYQDEQTLAYGATPTLPTLTEAPTKEADAQYTYRFDGWRLRDGADTLVTDFMVTRDAVYVPHYEAFLRSYDIHYYAEDGKALGKMTLAYGKDAYAAAPKMPRRSASHFAYWADQNGNAVRDMTVRSNASYYAHYEAN